MTLPYVDQGAAYSLMEFNGTNFSNQGTAANINWQVLENMRVPRMNCPSSTLPPTRTQNANANTVALDSRPTLTYQVADYSGMMGVYFMPNTPTVPSGGEWTGYA